MSINKKKIKEQTKFCENLMNKLSESVEENMEGYEELHYCVPNYTQIRNDIVRLRRELQTLSAMLCPHESR